MFKTLFASLALLLANLWTTQARADAIDQIVLSGMKLQHSPGIGISIVKDGHVLKMKGYGYSNVELLAPATSSTFFQTGSMGKQFTAALVMLLVRDGRLKLDDPVSSYLPETPLSWQGITVRQLLAHTSGLDSTDDAIDLHKDYTEEERLASAYKMPLISKPGKKYSYSNLGYQVLGIICSKVGGKFWGEQLRERVFVPLGMKSRVISESDIVPGRAAGYDRIDGMLKNQQSVAPSQNTTADGSLYVTPQDMARWSIALAGQQILSNKEKEDMWQPARLSDGQLLKSGFGWELSRKAGHRLVTHDGYWQGFSTYILHFPDDHLTVAVLMNKSNAQPQEIAGQIAAHYIPSLWNPPADSPLPKSVSKVSMFLRGSMNNWKDTAQLVEVKPQLFQVRLRLMSGMQQFKIGDADWKVANLGARFDEALVNPGKPQALEFRGDDLFLLVDKQGEYTFQLDLREEHVPILTVIPSPDSRL